MPARSNARQRVVAILRKHWASEGVTVTESKFLRDAVTGYEREVDVVVEGEFEGNHTVISFEVVDHTRPAGLPWVEQMIQKHDRLETNRLMLVSWSGFTGPAIKRVESSPGRVVMVTPKQIFNDDGTPRISDGLYIDEIRMTPREQQLLVRSEDGDEGFLGAESEALLFTRERLRAGTVGGLVQHHLNGNEVGKQLGMQAHGDADRETLTGFEVSFEMNPDSVFVHTNETDAWLEVLRVNVRGDFKWIQNPLAIEVFNFDGRGFGTTKIKLADKEVVVVVTPNGPPDEYQLAWRAVE